MKWKFPGTVSLSHHTEISNNIGRSAAAVKWEKLAEICCKSRWLWRIAEQQRVLMKNDEEEGTSILDGVAPAMTAI